MFIIRQNKDQGSKAFKQKKTTNKCLKSHYSIIIDDIVLQYMKGGYSYSHEGNLPCSDLLLQYRGFGMEVIQTKNEERLFK
jgi:hypothetical protein